MKKIYIDRTVNAGCTGVWVKDAQAVSAGATLYVMSAKEDGPEYRRIEKEYDIHFFFEGKNVPGIDSPGGIDFYTIPQVDIFAADSTGGFFGTVGGTTDPEGELPICYIDGERKCFMIAVNGRSFLDSLPDWGKDRVPAEDIRFFPSRQEAARAEEFIHSYDTVFNNIEERYREILGENLVGIYVHGSIAFSCFTWETGDIDFIVVIDSPLEQCEKESLIRALLDLDEKVPPKGLEMSVVLRRNCDPFVYPTPFELHFSNAHRENCKKDLFSYCRDMHGTDRDLAAHFTVIRKAGFALCGTDAASLFGEVPEEAYLDSIKRDVAQAGSEILENPVYMILNLCRILAYIREKLVLSKRQGGQWGLKNLSGEYRPMIRRALQSYAGRGEFREEEARLAAFAREMTAECKI